MPGWRTPSSTRLPSASKICTRSRPFGASATANVPLAATSKAVGSITRPSSAPICTSFAGASANRQDLVRSGEPLVVVHCQQRAVLEPLIEPAKRVCYVSNTLRKVSEVEVTLS